MKKFFSLLIALMLICSLAPAMADKLVISTECTFPPYEYYDGEKPVGIDLEIAEAIARAIIEADGKLFVQPGLHEALEQAVKLGYFPADADWDAPMTRREGAILALKLRKGGENP